MRDGSRRAHQPPGSQSARPAGRSPGTSWLFWPSLDHTSFRVGQERSTASTAIVLTNSPAETHPVGGSGRRPVARMTAISLSRIVPFVMPKGNLDGDDVLDYLRRGAADMESDAIEHQQAGRSTSRRSSRHEQVVAGSSTRLPRIRAEAVRPAGAELPAQLDTGAGEGCWGGSRSRARGWRQDHLAN